MGGRRFVTLLVALAGLALAAPAAASVTERERSLLDEMNRVRAMHGVAALRLDRTLQRAARTHSSDMLRGNYFAHGSFSARMKRFRVRGRRVAENLAWARRRAGARMVVRMWLRSPSHRANLLRPGFRRVGVAVLEGRLAGRRATVVTADFAGR